MVKKGLIGLAILVVLLVVTVMFNKDSFNAGKAAAEADAKTKQTQQLKQ